MNRMLTATLGSLHREAGSAVLRLRHGELERSLQILNGDLVAARSNVVSERLGSLLAAEGRLDAALIEPVAAEASRNKRLLGDQLVIDGLITPGDLAAVLERQTLGIFRRALMMAGDVQPFPVGAVQAVCHQPAAGLVVAAAREATGAPQTVPEPARLALPAESEPIRRLGLMPAETRVLRRLTAGATAAQLSDLPNPDAARRLVAALHALGFLTTD
jgi:hypothetical protein